MKGDGDMDKMSTRDAIRVYLAELIDKEIYVNNKMYENAVSDIIDNHSNGYRPDYLFFDEDYYLSQRGTRFETSETPLRDFFEKGYKLGISPHPLIDIDYVHKNYASANPHGRDYHADHIMNPFLHIFSDTKNTASANALFDIEVYRNCVEGLSFGGVPVESMNLHPVVHYLRNWKTLHERSRLAISNYFDPIFYDLSSSRKDASLTDPMSHYFRSSIADRPDCNPKFHGNFYRITYNVQDIDTLSHFLQYGAAKGFSPNPYALNELGLKSTMLAPNALKELLIDYTKIR